MLNIPKAHHIYYPKEQSCVKQAAITAFHIAVGSSSKGAVVAKVSGFVEG